MNKVFKTEVVLNRQYLESIKASDYKTWMKVNSMDVLKMWASKQNTYKLDELDIEAFNTTDSYGWDVYLLNDNYPICIKNL